MLLEKLDILNFKNIEEASLEFSSGANCLVGSNGMGKSNLLEAIYYLSMGRSSRALTDSELVRHEASQMLLRAHYAGEPGSGIPDTDVSIGWNAGHRKQLRRDGKECRRLSDHVGAIPVVLAESADLALVTSGPEERRRLADNVISQADASYLQHLQRYNDALRQRNSMLRGGLTDPLLLESVEMQMGMCAAQIAATRRRWCEEIASPFARFHSLIAPQEDTASIAYTPSVAEGDTPEAFADAIGRSRRRDEALGHTTVGPHRDDFSLSLSGRDVRRVGSQGQMKSFTIALRLALFSYLSSHSSTLPLLLLDDIFDKLDAERVEHIVATVTDPQLHFGQIFITDTNRKHIDSILSRSAGHYRLFGVERGSFTLLDQA